MSVECNAMRLFERRTCRLQHKLLTKAVAHDDARPIEAGDVLLGLVHRFTQLRNETNCTIENGQL